MKGNRYFLIFCLVVILSIVTSCARKEIVRPPASPAKVALVLGAGAAKGFAHIGVLKVLESNQIPVHLIVGTSAGSFIGSLYAYGYNAFQLQKMALSIEKKDIIDLTIPDNGFIKGELLEAYINRMVINTPMDKFRLPFYAVATNIQTGQEVIFGSGNVGTAVRASCSIPGIFRPVNISGNVYVDGGVVSPVAVDAAKKMGADVVIAVDISADAGSPTPESTIETILSSINIMYSQISRAQVSKADIVIKPQVAGIGAADFSKKHDAIIEGEKATYDALPKIKALLERLRNEGRL